MHAEQAPLVSVVIPTFARPKILRACLQGIANLQFDRTQLEVIVVDDGSPERVPEVIAEFRDRLQVRLLTQRRAGPGAARNAGVGIAAGRYLAFIDDDCVPAPDWLTILADELARDDRRLLGGRIDNALTGNPFSDASDRIGRFVYQYYLGESAKERFFTANNMALSAERFRAIGGFDTTIPSATAEDKEFCDRWQAGGLELAHVPRAVVHHAHQLGFARFLRQHFNYGRGILSFRLTRRQRTPRGTILPESWRFYRDLLTSPLREPNQRPAWRAFALVAVAQLATLAGAGRQAVSHVLGRRARRTPTGSP